MNKTKMDFSICKSDQEWFEDSCSMWVDHYNFLLGLPWNSKEETVWFKEQMSINKLYDV